jgi:methionyl-tRNA formyltransferase
MLKTNKKIVMVGCLESGWEIIHFLLEQGIRFDYFVCLNPEQGKRYFVSGYKDFSALAEKFNIPVYFPRTYTLKNPEDQAFFKNHKFDLLIQGGWQRLFSNELLQTLSIGAIGLHGSPKPLPFGRGRSTINWALIDGEKEFIMHYFLIKPGIDDGDIFHTVRFDITAWDDCRSLFYKYSIASKYALFEWATKLLTQKVEMIPQNGEEKYYPKRTPSDGIIDWNQETLKIYNLIRAVTKPYPGAFTFLSEEKIFIWKAQPFDFQLTYPKARTGEVVEVFQSGDFVVKAKDGLLLVTDFESDLKTLSVGDFFQ